MKHTKKAICSVLICLMLVGTVQPPKAHGIFLLAALLVASGGLLIWDHNSCWLNWFWGCDSDGPGGSPKPGDACVSDMNICKGRGAGFIQPDGSCSAVKPPDSACTPCDSAPNECGIIGHGLLVDGVCNAAIPGTETCPPVAAPGGQLTALPSRFIAAVGNSVELAWDIKMATNCSLIINGQSQVASTTSHPDGFRTAPLLRPATDIVLSCYNTSPENKATWAVKIAVNPKPGEF